MRRPGAWAALALLAALAIGCRSAAPEVFVPVMQTAAEQYAYALKFKESSRAELVTDKDKYEKAREVIMQTYAKVPENFPDDRQFTPLAKLDIIDMRCGFDSQRVKLEGREQERVMHQAIRDLADLAQKYPENEQVQAKTLYDRGMCHKALGEFNKMQEYFKALIDKYSKSLDSTIQNLARRADYFYKHTYVKGE